MKRIGLTKALVIAAVFLTLLASVSFLALAINDSRTKEELLPSASPTPTFMPSQISIVTPSPTATVYPSTPTPASPTPSASSSPAVTQTPAPSSTPVSTSTPTPTAAPTSTPAPTSAPDSAYTEGVDGEGAWMPMGNFVVASPTNQTYNTSSVTLDLSAVTLVKTPTFAYSIDGGPRIPINQYLEVKPSDPLFQTSLQVFVNGSITLPPMSNGSHVIVVYGDLRDLPIDTVRRSKTTVNFKIEAP